MKELFEDQLLQIERSEKLHEVCNGIQQNRYYSILGPKKIGKTTFLKQVKEKLEKESETYLCIYIDLGSLKTATPLVFYTDFAELVSRATKFSYKEKVDSITSFSVFLESMRDSIDKKIVLLLDEIENIPDFLTKDLLDTFRAFHQKMFMNPFKRKISVIVSGSTNLLEFTMGDPNSPFNIADPLLLSDLGPDMTGHLIDMLLKGWKVKIATTAKEKILNETGGQPYLVNKLCRLCAYEIKEKKLDVITCEIIEQVMGRLIENYEEDEFFSFIIKRIESDLDIFQTLIDIMANGFSSRKNLEVTISKLELSGAFKIEGNSFKIRNPVTEKLLTLYFDSIRKADIFTFHGEWDKAVELYKNEELLVRSKRRWKGKVALLWRRRSDIIKAIGTLMYRPEGMIEQIFNYLLDGIHYALAYDTVHIYKVDLGKGELILEGFRGSKPKRKNIKIVDYSQILEIRAYNLNKSSGTARSVQYVLEDKNEDNNFAVAIPLCIKEGDIKWILSIYNRESRIKLDHYNCEELKIFAGEAVLAIRNATDYYDLFLQKELILESMGEEVSIIDSEYHILYMNKEKIERIGADHSKKGAKCFKIFAHSEIPCNNCPCLEAMKTGEVIRMNEYSNHAEYHNDQNPHWVIQTASPLKDANGKCTRAINIVRDVSKQIKLFGIIEKLQAELDFNKLIAIIMDGIVDLGYKRSRFYDYIRTEEETGLINEFIIGRTCRGMEKTTTPFTGYRIDLDEIKYLDDTLRNGKPQFYFGNTEKQILKDKKWLRDLDLIDVKWMDLPLISGQKLLGIIGIDNYNQGKEFTDEDLKMLAILASYTAQALEKSLYIKRQEVLYKISKKLSQTLDIKTLQKDIVQNICEVLQTEMCSIIIYDEDKKKLIRQAIFLHSKTGWTHDIPFEETYDEGSFICGGVFKNGVPKIIPNIWSYKGPKFEEIIKKYEKYLNSGKVKNAIFAPVTFGPKKIGIVRTSNKLDEYNHISSIGFKKEDLDLLVSLGEQIAIVLQNSKLYEHQKESIHQLEVLTEISHFIQKEGDLEKIFYLILTGVTTQGGVEFNRAILFLVDRDKNKLNGIMAIGPADCEDARRIWEQPVWEEFKQNKKSHEILDFAVGEFEKKKDLLLGESLNKKCKEFKYDLDETNVLLESIKSKKTLIYENHQNQDTDMFLKNMDAQYWAVTPLIFDKDSIGVLFVDNRFNSHPITNQQIEILKLFANQAAVAIHNSEAAREKSDQLKGLEALNQVIAMIASAADLKEIYNAIKGTLEIFKNVDEMCLLVRDEEQGFTPQIGCPHKTTDSCENCKELERQCIRVAGSYEFYYCPNIDDDPFFIKAIKKHLKSRFIFPLVFNDELLGIFDLGSNVANAFSEFNRKLFKSLGYQIAIALNNRIKQDNQREIFRDISHELGSYLTTIQGFSQKFCMGKVNALKEEKIYKMMYGDCVSLINAVEEIKSLNSIETHSIVFNMKELVINEIIDAFVDHNLLFVQEKNLRLVNHKFDKKILINGDKMQLDRALQSLINNAVKFSKENKEIHISTEAKNGFVYINIKDQGIGIRTEEKEKIFKKYYRGKYAKEMKIEGTGIGLATVHHIISKHEGTISVNSILGTGSIFTIKLPIFNRGE